MSNHPSVHRRTKVAAIAVGTAAVIGIGPLANAFTSSSPGAFPQIRTIRSDPDHTTHQTPEQTSPIHAGANHGSHQPGTNSAAHDAATHSAALGLVDATDATHVATQSGAWANASTWTSGNVPTSGSRVIVPAGVTVTVNSMIHAPAKTIGVEGTLRFAHDVDSELRVDTLVTHPQGTLEIGTPSKPIAADVTARIVFTDDGPIDRSWDPGLLSRGALLHGTTVIQGAEITHRNTLAVFPVAGDRTLQLTSGVTGWQVGDQVVITGTNGPTSDERRTVTAIDGTMVELDAPLELDHVPPADDLDLYVANLSRNVQFASENPEVDRRGHLMVMHTLDAQIRGARFSDMGRTDKSRELDDWQFEEVEPGGVGWNGEATALDGTNVRGRYSVHVHRGGADPRVAPAVISDSVVTGDPGWAFTNHSSHVDFERNVAYDNAGAGFFTEAGDEVGRWIDNIAIRTVMPNFQVGDEGAIDPDLRADRQDFGVDGDGFWLQGNRMDLVGNVSAGSSAHGIVWWSEALAEADLGRVATVAVDTLPDPSLVPDRDQLSVWWAPLGEVRDNVAYGSTVGFRSRYVHGATYLDDPSVPPAAYIDSLRPVFDGMTTWNVRDGVLMNYNERITLRNVRAIGIAEPFRHNYGHTAAVGVGIDVGNDATFGPGAIEDIDVSGFEVGLIGPRHGAWTINDATISATTDVLVHAPEHTERSLDLSNLTFGSLDGTALEGRDDERRNVVLAYDYNGDGDGVDPTTIGEPDRGDGPLLADRVTLDGRGLYSPEAATVPEDATTDARVVNGVVGEPAPVPSITHTPRRGGSIDDDGEPDADSEDDDEVEEEEEEEDDDDGDSPEPDNEGEETPDDGRDEDNGDGDDDREHADEEAEGDEEEDHDEEDRQDDDDSGDSAEIADLIDSVTASLEALAEGLEPSDDADPGVLARVLDLIDAEVEDLADQGSAPDDIRNEVIFEAIDAIEEYLDSERGQIRPDDLECSDDDAAATRLVCAMLGGA